MRTPILPGRTIIFALCALLGKSVAAQAQQNQTAPTPAPGVWFTVNGDSRLSQRLGLHTDLHWRGARPATRTAAQNLLRLGLNVHLGEQAVLTAGYAYAHALPSGDGRSPAAGTTEQRLFQQLQFGEQTGALWTRHRYRLEERWLSNPTSAAPSYRTRLRYQLRALLPLRRDHQLLPGTAYLVGANEFFLNLGGPSFFDQNRASLLLGLQLSSAAALEAGIVSQTLSAGNSLDGAPGTVLQIGFSFSPDLRHGRELLAKNEQ